MAHTFQAIWGLFFSPLMTFRWVRSCLFFKCQENADAMDAKIRDYYKFQAALLEPWDGPALVCFTDGDGVGRVTHFAIFFVVLQASG